MTNVGFHGLFPEEEPVPDLAIHETVGNQLEHFDLAPRRLLFELLQGPIERNHLAVAVLLALRQLPRTAESGPCSG